MALKCLWGHLLGECGVEVEQGVGDEGECGLFGGIRDGLALGEMGLVVVEKLSVKLGEEVGGGGGGELLGGEAVAVVNLLADARARLAGHALGKGA